MFIMAGPTSFLTELLSQWVQWPTEKHPVKPTLNALCMTLRSSPVGLRSLANQVEMEMKHSSTGKGWSLVDLEGLQPLQPFSTHSPESYLH